MFFLGNLTLEVNNFVGPDGFKVRGSTANSRATRTRKPKCRVSIKPIEVAKTPLRRVKAFSPDAWNEAWHRCHSTMPKPHEGVSRSTGIKRAEVSLSSTQAAACQDWWHESRSQSLQPRPARAPSAAERLEVLRSRIAGRS